MGGGYLGRGLNPGHFTIDRFAGDASEVSFLLTYTPGSTTAITVIYNNVMQEPDEAYSVSGKNIIFTAAPDLPPAGVTNNIYVIHNGLALSLPTPADGSVGQLQLAENVKNFYPETFAGTGAQTDYTLTYPVQKASSLLVRENGVVQKPVVDYDVLVDETTLRFTTAPANGVDIDITYLGLRGTEDVIAGQLVEYIYTATASQTIFSGSDDNALTLAYNVGYINVFQNGTKLLTGTDFTAIDGTSVTLTVGATVSDTIEILTYGTWLPVDSYTKAEVDAVVEPKMSSLTATVTSNALTLGLKSQILSIRNSTLDNGIYNMRSFGDLSLIIPSGATLGTIDTIQNRLILLAIDNVGTVELAVVNLSGGNNLDETTLISTTAIDATSDIANIIYSTTARTNVPFRVVGFVESTQATSGTWVTSPTTIQGAGGRALERLDGQIWQSVTRAKSTTYYNTTGRPINIMVRATNTSVNGYFRLDIVQAGGSTAIYSSGSPAASGIMALYGKIPPGASYALNDVGGTTTIAAVRELR